jgi:hypothetical protein
MFFPNSFLQASEIIPRNLNPINFSFQSGLSIAVEIMKLEQARVVFSPRLTAILCKLSAATDEGSFLAYSSVSSSAYQASISSALSTSVIMYARAGKKCSYKSFRFFLNVPGIDSAQVLIISRAD